MGTPRARRIKEDTKQNLRKCHTPGCNNMITDYRCEDCWMKMQGFVPHSKSDQGIIESGGAKTSRRHSTRPD